MSSKRAMTVVLMFVLLAVLAIPASAAPVIPLNYCTTASAHQETGLTTFEVNATGSGRYARLVEYPVSGAPVVIAGPHDFGANATVYQFTHVPLNPARAYQVQTSHTSLTTGYSTTGCVLSPPPLYVDLEYFYGGFRSAHWAVTSEWGIASYKLYRGTPASHGTFVASVPAQCPGCTAGAAYAVNVGSTLAKGSVYWLEVTDLLGGTSWCGPSDLMPTTD